MHVEENCEKLQRLFGGLAPNVNIFHATSIEECRLSCCWAEKIFSDEDVCEVSVVLMWKPVFYLSLLTSETCVHLAKPSTLSLKHKSRWNSKQTLNLDRLMKALIWSYVHIFCYGITFSGAWKQINNTDKKKLVHSRKTQSNCLIL